MSPNSTRNLGKYQIIEEIGKGGFATVYRAQDLDLSRPVALKVLDPVLTRDPIWVARFRREARAVASLDHPRIVTVHEIGQAEGVLYIAMKLVEGGSLAERLKQAGGLPWPEVVRLVEQIAEALDFAHAQGVLHRDLKPANVLLDRRTGAVLTDFGFARLVADHSLSVSMSGASGGIVGTPAYIAPEIWEGETPAVQTDVYALGCILYEVVTGQMLFTGHSAPAVMRAHFQPR
jgi:serine/threonine protein kinase